MVIWYIKSNSILKKKDKLSKTYHELQHKTVTSFGIDFVVKCFIYTLTSMSNCKFHFQVQPNHELMVNGTRNLAKASEYTEDVIPETKVNNTLSSDYSLQSPLNYDSADLIQQGAQKKLKIMSSEFENAKHQ